MGQTAALAGLAGLAAQPRRADGAGAAAGADVVQAAGLTIHALDRVDLQRFAQAREISARAISAWRTVILAPADRRGQMLAELELPRRGDPDDRAGRIDHRRCRAHAGAAARPAAGRRASPARGHHLLEPRGLWRGPRGALADAARAPDRCSRRDAAAGLGLRRRWPGFLVSLRLPSGEWLNLRVFMPPPRPWHSETFLIAFAAMTLAAGLLILWAVRRLTRPVRALAEAAERLGRDVNAPPMPEAGPTEVAKAAHAFNTMAERIRRFVGDRTQMLAAIGHDLRTPITRLRLRAEFMDDDEQRRKMLADLDEMEAMVAATLAFARDDSAGEPTVPLDLAALLPHRAGRGGRCPARPRRGASATRGRSGWSVQARPVALKRALANLIGNALAYGGAARLVLAAPEAPGRPVRLAVEDDGPGIPPESLEAVFQPFRRLEASRNRETGGTGLGLPIARNILRAHGGDVVLRNRPGGGLVALANLPG